MENSAIPVAVATFRLSSPSDCGIRALRKRARISAGSPSPSVPATSAMRGDAGMSRISTVPRGDSVQISKPRSASPLNRPSAEPLRS